MARSLEQIPDIVLRIGLAAENAFNSKQPFTLSLAFSTYSSALAFRKSFYSARSYLRSLKQRRPADIMPLIQAYTGLERLSCARLDREPATISLRETGCVYVNISMNALFSDLDQQLSALGIPDLDPGYNLATTTTRDMTAIFSGMAAPTPSATPDGTPHRPSVPIEIPLTPSVKPGLASSMPLFDSEFTPNDVTSRSLHETLAKLSEALCDHAIDPTAITQSNVRRNRRKLLDAMPTAISDTLRTHLLEHPGYDDILAQDLKI